MAVGVGHRPSGIGSNAPLAGGERKLVKGFAACGAFFVLLQSYVFGRWLLSGNLRRTPVGPNPVPHWMSVVILVVQIAVPLAFLIALYYLVVRPWRRDRTMTLHGLLYLAMPFIYFQDLGSGYLVHAYTWNAAFFNLGSWYNFIPGWQSSRAQYLVEPILFAPFLFSLGMLLPAIGINALMRKMKARWPHFGRGQILGIGFGVMVGFDLILEPALVRLGVFTFAGAIPSLTLFAGHYYQFPLYELLLFSALCPGAFIALLYLRNDRGETIAERGLDRLQVKPRRKATIRFLALVGAANLALLAYNVTYGATTLVPSFRWADDIVNERSYLRNNVCGPGTDEACPGHTPSAQVP